MHENLVVGLVTQVTNQLGWLLSGTPLTIVFPPRKKGGSPVDEATSPLFQQVAELIADAIVDGSLEEGQRAPSTNELAEFHSINPATARKGLTLLVDQGVLSKRRGVGMFVEVGARQTILKLRQGSFAASYVVPLIDEAVKLGFDRAYVHTLIDQVAESRGLYE